MRAILILFILFSSSLFALDRGDPCPFCNRKIIDRQKFYEDDLIIALYSYKPLTPGHILIIPKAHRYEYEELSDQEAIAIHKMIKRVNSISKKHFGTQSYLILQKNGESVGQTVPHVHFHYIPRAANDTSKLRFLLRFFNQYWQRPLGDEKLRAMAHKMKKLLIEDDISNDGHVI